MIEPFAEPADTKENQYSDVPNRIMEQPGEISILQEGQGWIFRSDLSTPGSWSFIGREREGNSTRFRFLFIEPGNWNLVFDRQDLSMGKNERQERRIVVDGGKILDNAFLNEAESPDTVIMNGDLNNAFPESLKSL